MMNNTINTMNAAEIISSTGIIDLESAKTLRDINAKLNTRYNRLGEATTNLAVMVKNGFFSAFNEYLNGASWMNYNNNELNKIEFENVVINYNELMNEKNELVKEIEELKNAVTSFRIPETYMDLMEEV